MGEGDKDGLTARQPQLVAHEVMEVVHDDKGNLAAGLAPQLNAGLKEFEDGGGEVVDGLGDDGRLQQDGWQDNGRALVLELAQQ